MRHREFVEALDRRRIVEAIGRAERTCSGELRVHLQPRTRGDLRREAERTFERLGMTATEQRNGVLLFVATEEQRFCILGDRGIDERVGPRFWEEIAHRLTERFRAGEYTDGIVEALEAAGSQLSCHFPWADDDVDELPDDLSIADEPVLDAAPRRRVLIVCTGNSCRSQMAEGWIRALRGDRWEVASAGTAPAAAVHPMAVRAMAEAGVDLSEARPEAVDRYLGERWDLVVTVCGGARESCPTVPSAAETVHVGFDDPAEAVGGEDERYAVFRRVRDEIRERLLPELDRRTGGGGGPERPDERG